MGWAILRFLAAALVGLQLAAAPVALAQQPAAALSPDPKLQFFDNNGKPLTGGKLFTYLAGTTTKVTTYTDSTAGTPNSNPIILNTRGEAQSGGIWLGTGQFKYVLAPSTDTDPPTHAIWTVDNIQSPLSAGGFSPASQFGVVCDGVTDTTAGMTAMINWLNAATGNFVIMPVGKCRYHGLLLPKIAASGGGGI